MLFIVSHSSLSMKEARTETQTNQEPEGRSWCRGHGMGEMLFTVLLFMACSAFLREPRTTSSGMAPPTMGWAFLHQSLIKEMPTGFPAAWSYRVIALIEVPYFQMTLACVSWHKTSHHNIHEEISMGFLKKLKSGTTTWPGCATPEHFSRKLCTLW